MRTRWTPLLGHLLAVAATACGVHISDGQSSHDITIDSGTVDAPKTIDAGIDATVAPPPCTTPSVQSGSGCFTFHSDLLDWTDAESTCEAASSGEHLAIVRDATTNAAIGTLIGSNDVFLGGTDAVVEGTWLWTDTTQFWSGGSAGAGGGPVNMSFTDFNVGEPNNGGTPSTHEEDCLVMRGDKNDAWDDRPCGPEPGAGGVGQTVVTYAYVCERAAP